MGSYTDGLVHGKLNNATPCHETLPCIVQVFRHFLCKAHGKPDILEGVVVGCTAQKCTCRKTETATTSKGVGATREAMFKKETKVSNERYFSLPPLAQGHVMGKALNLRKKTRTETMPGSQLIETRRAVACQRRETYEPE